MLFRFVFPTGNRKTGPVAVVTAERSTCPKTCPFLGNGCYAEQPPLRWHWDKLSKGRNGDPIDVIIEKLGGLGNGTIVRYGDAGDLPGDGVRVHRPSIMKLAKVAEEKSLILFAYTHYLTATKKDRRYNLKVVRDAIDRGFLINISVESPKEARKFTKMGLPVAVVLNDAEDIQRYVDEGVKVQECMANVNPTTTCWSCGHIPFCARKNRKAAVGFPVHGNRSTREKAKNVIGRKR